MVDSTLLVVIVVVAVIAVVVPLVLGLRGRSKATPSPIQPLPASTLVPAPLVVLPPELAKVEEPFKPAEPAPEPAKPVEALAPIELTPVTPASAAEPIVEKPVEIAAPVTVIEQTLGPATEAEPKPEPKPVARRVRSTKPRKPRTTKAKKE
jgi:hypothetical protein